MQKALGITADGVYGPTTDAALKGKAKDVVVQIQTELAKYGYYTGPIDGKLLHPGDVLRRELHI